MLLAMRLITGNFLARSPPKDEPIKYT